MNSPLANTQASSPPTSEALGHRRGIRSFVLRNGRITLAQARALEVLAPQYTLPYQTQTVDWQTVFGREAPLILEIGFGMGEATAHIAKIMPEVDFIACEVHSPGVGALLCRIEKEGLRNIRIVQHDAVEVLRDMVADASLSGVHVFFPDPWHKKRHNKRRLIQAETLQLLVQKLKNQGYIHTATDWEDYALHMQAEFKNCPLLRNTSTQASGFVQPPVYRPRTKFENRGLRLGHGVWDSVWQKQA